MNFCQLSFVEIFVHDSLTQNNFCLLQKRLKRQKVLLQSTSIPNEEKSRFKDCLSVEYMSSEHSVSEDNLDLENSSEDENVPRKKGAIILGTKKMTTTRTYIIYIKNHFYCLPEQAKPHQGGGKTEAVPPPPPPPPDAARPNGQTTKRRKKRTIMIIIINK